MAGRLQDIFEHAIALSGPEREAYLRSACGSDTTLRAEVDSLLLAHLRAEKFLASPTLDTPSATPTIADSSYKAPPDAAPLREGPGTRIGPYKLLQVIGEGGFGSVFMAEQAEPVRRQVALKIIKLGMDTGQVVARFEQERQALAILNHPNIAKVFDAGATQTGRPYFVMELCTGEPIDDYCDRHSLSIADRLGLFAQVCSAVQHAHTKGIIHRDLKPSNILVSLQDDRACAKVIDFGIAKATNARFTERTLFTEHRQMIGTPEYMSPEQAEGSLDIDTRTDVYSLGVLLYELLTGSTPFPSADLRSAAYAEIQRIIREVDPPRPSTRLTAHSDTIADIAARRRTEPRRLGTMVRGELDWIVMKALEKDRHRRYESANGLAMDIQRYLAGEAVMAAPPSTAYQIRKFVKRNKGPVIAGAVVTSALVLGIVGTSVGMLRARESARAESIAKNTAERKRLEAETNLAFAKKGNEILGSVFINLDPQVTYHTLAEFRSALRSNLDGAITQLDGTAIGDPLTVAEMQNTLGRSIQRLGDPQRAIPLFEKSLATFQATLGPSHQHTLDATNNLAVAYLDLSKPDLALPLLEAAQSQREATLGLESPDTIVGMCNLGGTYFNLQKFDRAEQVVTRALDLSTRHLGPDHMQTLRCMTSLAQLYASTDRADRAVPLIKDTIQRQSAGLGKDHPDTLVSVQSLANAYAAAGQGNLALPTLEDAYRRARTSLGDDHLVTINIACQLATIYWGMGRATDAVPIFDRALAHQERLLGRDNESTLNTIANLGVNYKDTGRLDAAVPLLEEAFRASERYPDLGFVAQPLLDAYIASGELAKAAPLLETALAQARANTPPGSPQLSGTMAQLGLARLTLKQWDQAETILRECLAIRERGQPNAWQTFNTRSMLGGALLGQKRYTDAEPLLLAGYQGLKECESALPPQARQRPTEALDRIVQLYEALGNTAAAAEWRAKREPTPPESATPGSK